MVKIAYILLCHKDPDALIRKAISLTAAGDCVTVHFDARAHRQVFARMKTALQDNPRVAFTHNRVRCGWGTWSLVQATLNAIETALSAFPDATHLYLMSGDCAPIKTAEYAHDFLSSRDCDYIESFDFFASDWIKTGLREDRLIYRHIFNERSQKRLFYTSFHLQKRLGLTRSVPQDLRMMIGSQWWCLRRASACKIVDFVKTRHDIVRFFKTSWIPDETFFQTVIRHLVPDAQIENRTLTFLMFSDYGMPVTFYNDHHDLLLGQDYLLARKISPEAEQLKTQLEALYPAKGHKHEITNEGRALYGFLARKGRVGQRFTQPFWAPNTQFPRGSNVLLIICKKWHVAKRLVAGIRHRTNLPCFEYVFDENQANPEGMGGLETEVAKRIRHRRMCVRQLMDMTGSNQIVMCMDPANVDVIQDFCADQAQVRVLFVDCQFSDAYLAGHATRIGLVAQNGSSSALSRVMPALRQDIAHEIDRIEAARFLNYNRISEVAPYDINAKALQDFLTTSPDIAQDLARTDHLFSD